MNFETARALIADHFQDNWNASWLTVVHENQQKAPTSGTWGRFVIMQGATNPATIGRQGFTRGAGIAVLQVFVPEGGGTKTFTDMADHMAGIFNLLRLNDGQTYLKFDTVGIVPVGSKDGWLQRNLTVSFTRDDHS